MFLAGGIVLLVILVLAGGFFAIKAWSSHPEPEQEIPALESAAEFETESEQKPEKVKVVEKVPESETEEEYGSFKKKLRTKKQKKMSTKRLLNILFRAVTADI